MTILRMALIALLGAWSVSAPAQTVQTLDTAPLSEPIGTLQTVSGAGTTQIGTGGCATDADCDDDVACTQDACVESSCVHTSIPGCVRCSPGYSCAPVELVFIMDTSGSMRDEAIALCGQIDDVLTNLGIMGASVTARVLGITNTGDLSFICLEDHVVSLFGSYVPGVWDTCDFPGGESSYESWGPATAIVADRFPWTVGATHIVVPISDEGPCNGSRPDGCNDPGDDRDSITNAGNIAAAKGVIVSPVTGTGSDACVIGLAQAIAAQTGGIAVQTTDAGTDIAGAIAEIVLATCTEDYSCDDQNVCTDQDTCTDGQCLGTPNYDDATYCCDHETGALGDLDDGDPCTQDACDPETGQVVHTPADPGTACDDGDPCTVTDACDASGGCTGTDLNTIICAADDDCFGASCNTDTGYCVCSGIPTLCLNAHAPRMERSCYAAGETIEVDIELGFSTNVISGADLYFEYDPSVLQFETIVPGAYIDPTSPYQLQLFRDINETAGTVFYSVGITLGGYGTQGPALMARATFTALASCQQSTLCWLGGNPQRTTLADMRGQVVPFESCCSDPIVVSATDVMMTCPDSAVVTAEPGSPGLTLNWNAPAASSDCQEQMQLTCTATNSEGVDIDYLIDGGGLIPQGISEFSCTAEDSCGVTATCGWTIEVEPTTLVEVDLELSPTMASGGDGTTLDRCIEFELYSNCSTEPVRVEKTVSFGPPFNLQGQAIGVVLEVPPGDYRCIHARDPLHTLRNIAYPTIEGDRFKASFLGDPRLGGNWLWSGNLDGNGAIDVVDFGIFVDYYMTEQAADTPCDTPGINADFNGDAFVDGRDWQFISDHLDMTDMVACCDGTTAAAPEAAIQEITVDELIARGLGRLVVADLNHDGVLNRQDIDIFRAGGVSPKSWLKGSRDARSLRDRRETAPSK